MHPPALRSSIKRNAAARQSEWTAGVLWIGVVPRVRALQARIAGQKTHPPPVLHKGVGELWHFRYTKREFPCGCVFIGSMCVYMYCTIYIHLYLPPLFFFYSDRRLETARPLFDSLSMRWRFIFSYLFIDVVATKFIISLAALLSRRRTPGKFNIH